jgi:hypothetical protein
LYYVYLFSEKKKLIRLCSLLLNPKNALIVQVFYRTLKNILLRPGFSGYEPLVSQRLGGSQFEASPDTKLMRPPAISRKKPSVATHAYNPSYKGGIGGRVKVQGQP